MKRLLRYLSTLVLIAIVIVFLLAVLAHVSDKFGSKQVNWRGVDSGYSNETTIAPEQPRSEEMSGKTRALVIFVVVLVIAASSLAAYTAFSYGRGMRIRSLEPTIAIEKLARLATLKVSVADILEAKAGGDIFGVKGAWLIKGDALLTVDMAKSKITEKDVERKTVTVQLPKPEVFQPRVDHSKTITYDVSKGLLVFGSERESAIRDEAMREAQSLVEQAAASNDTFKIARDVAEQIVKTVYKAVDWDATIVWADQQAPAK